MTDRPGEKPQPASGSDEPYFIIAPPSTMTVDHQYVPVLYLPNGTKKALVRRAGF